MIHVTQTYLPLIEDYTELLKRAWDKKWITNRGELVLELEEKLQKLLDVTYVTITNNGTIPLQIGLKLLAGDGSEVITTPFSYVATTSAILWENCKPVFVDIDPDYLTIDESKIEASITANTKAILATHVFGNPCNIEAIESIAQNHNLKVIYDAAHCFSVKYKGRSIFQYGDLSTCSFHATKLFHTGEGGAMFTNDAALQHRLYYSHNFGHNGPLDFFGLGINAKISELQAAMGLAMLPHMDEIILQRKRVVAIYEAGFSATAIQRLKIREGTEWNYSYYPVVFDSEMELLNVLAALNNASIYPRRYFYPSLNKLPFLNADEMQVSESIASRILCLPLYTALTDAEATTITELVINALN